MATESTSPKSSLDPIGEAPPSMSDRETPPGNSMDRVMSNFNARKREFGKDPQIDLSNPPTATTGPDADQRQTSEGMDGAGL